MSLSPFPWRHWLSSKFFFPLLLSSALAMAFFAVWQISYGPWQGPRLWLNLGLAWAPYLCSLWAVAAAERSSHTWMPIVIPGVLWLVFFPNAPYLITDWLYLERL